MDAKLLAKNVLRGTVSHFGDGAKRAHGLGGKTPHDLAGDVGRVLFKRTACHGEPQANSGGTPVKTCAHMPATCASA